MPIKVVAKLTTPTRPVIVVALRPALLNTVFEYIMKTSIPVVELKMARNIPTRVALLYFGLQNSS